MVHCLIHRNITKIVTLIKYTMFYFGRTKCHRLIEYYVPKSEIYHSIFNFYYEKSKVSKFMCVNQEL